MTEEQILEMWKKEVSMAKSRKIERPNGITELENFKNLISGLHFDTIQISSDETQDRRSKLQKYPSLTLYAGDGKTFGDDKRRVCIDSEDMVVIAEESPSDVYWMSYGCWYVEQMTEEGIYSLSIDGDSRGNFNKAVVEFIPNAIYEKAYPNMSVEEVKSGVLDRKFRFLTPNVPTSKKSIPIKEEDIPRLINRLAKEGLREVYETGSISLTQESMPGPVQPVEGPQVEVPAVPTTESASEPQIEESAHKESDQIDIIYNALKVIQVNAPYLLSEEQQQLIARLDASKKKDEEISQETMSIENDGKSK